MLIPDDHLQRLRDAGLLVSEQPFVSGHVAFPDGHIVGKPREAGGNGIAGMETRWGSRSGAIVDAPAVYFHREDDTWVVTVCEWVPGPGPGDFEHRHRSAEQAVADIVDYFFGSPARMAAFGRPMTRRPTAHRP